MKKVYKDRALGYSEDEKFYIPKIEESDLPDLDDDGNQDLHEEPDTPKDAEQYFE